ncbi:MAG TPA: 2'-5' RNA ligase family protein [Crinalium sp.]|jgi:2'-5' RNA ligase
MNADPNTPRFFIALLPPQAIQDFATDVIQELSDRYRTRTSKAPPHVTLQPPFQWPLDQVTALEQCLAASAEQHSPVPIALSGFGAFAPRVLYVNVLKTPELLALQSNLADALEKTLNIADPKSKQRPFAPHLTVASRNLTRQTFKQAWADLQPRSVEFEFLADRLTLLIHRGDRWQAWRDWVLGVGC